MKKLISSLVLYGTLALASLPAHSQGGERPPALELSPRDIIVDVYHDIIQPVSDPEIKNSNFDMFPNPCQDYLIIDFEEEAWRELEIYNLLGEKLGSHIAKGMRAHLKVDELLPGYYFLKINKEIYRFQKS